jgi:hypothetical protein
VTQRVDRSGPHFARMHSFKRSEDIFYSSSIASPISVAQDSTEPC